MRTLNYHFIMMTTVRLIIFVTVVLVSVSPAFALKSTDRFAKKGVLDLRGWNFTRQGPVSLAGEWQFHWNAHLSADKVLYSIEADEDHWIQVPGSWHNFSNNKKSIGGHGYATVALRVRIDKEQVPLGLNIRNVMTAYELFINGRLAEQVGQVGTSRETMTPEYRQVNVDLPEDITTIDIVMRISNFHHRLGGPWSKVVIGTRSSIEKDAMYRLVLNIFMVGSIFIMGLYHLCLFLLRRNYTPALFLGLFCLLITLRSLVTNERFLHTLFPWLSWEVLAKMEYLGFYLAVPVFALFIRSLFPKEASRVAITGYELIAAGFSLVVIFFPARIFSHTVLVYQVITISLCLYLAFVFYKAARNKRPGITAIIFGTVFLFISFINDLLHSNNILQTAYVLQAGLFVFIFSQAFVLSKMFSLTFQTIETQANHLMAMNSSLSREIQIREKLELSLRESHDQFKNSRIALILGLAKLAEYRDLDTGRHLERIREYVKIITEGLSQTSTYSKYITADYIDDIYHSSILHDIGKIGIADAILLKSGELTEDEFKIMKTHTLIGGDTITEVASTIKKRSFLTLARDIAYSHHERWDGTGYPKGLSGEQIPLCARITAIADVYDALTSERAYKLAFSHETAMEIILAEKEKQFDPSVVDVFCDKIQEIQQIRQKFQDI
ncbi:MAG: HD domain-containing protein [Desulfobacterales bacterium]|nr:HD domain-containing protein [Desulfobacterales bacterium]